MQITEVSGPSFSTHPIETYRHHCLYLKPIFLKWKIIAVHSPSPAFTLHFTLHLHLNVQTYDPQQLLGIISHNSIMAKVCGLTRVGLTSLLFSQWCIELMNRRKKSSWKTIVNVQFLNVATVHLLPWVN